MDEIAARRRLGSIARHLVAAGEVLSPNPSSSLDRGFYGTSPVIIGGMVLDINAVPDLHPLPGTTTPGKVKYVSGGVARNVAECMSKLGTRPFMISVVGIDMAGELLLKYWKSAGLPTNGILKSEGIMTPVVSNVYDCNGELAAAVASVEAVETILSPKWIRQFGNYIHSAPVLMVDANLNPESLEAACQLAAEACVPVWFEPVSITKSARITSIIHYITYASPNVNEVIAMANALSSGRKFNPINKGDIHSVNATCQMLKPAICLLLEKGIKVLFITLGPDGVFLCHREAPGSIKEAFHGNATTGSSSLTRELVNKSHLLQKSDWLMKTGVRYSYPYVYHFPAVSASVVSLTGAGDCLVGGTLASICTGFDLMQSTAVGIAVAKAAVESESNVPAGYSLTTIIEEAVKILSSVKQIVLD